MLALINQIVFVVMVSVFALIAISGVVLGIIERVSNRG